MSKTIVKQASFPFFPILALIFITLKLQGQITWSWLWVLPPFWAPWAAFIAIFAVVVFAAALRGR